MFGKAGLTVTRAYPAIHAADSGHISASRRSISQRSPRVGQRLDQRMALLLRNMARDRRVVRRRTWFSRGPVRSVDLEASWGS